MSLSLIDALGSDYNKYQIQHAEVCGFQTIAEADVVAAALKSSPECDNGYDVITFAAGLYYVLLITPEQVEATDGPTSEA